MDVNVSYAFRLNELVPPDLRFSTLRQGVVSWGGGVVCKGYKLHLT